jgi:sodium-dependent phosphate cotransporter
VKRQREWYVKQARRIAAALVAILLFGFALEIMKSGARGLTPLLRGGLDIKHAADCLGLGWLMACLVLSGSPAAAMAIALVSAEALTQIQAFAMISGSRLGASFIVLLLGFIYTLRGHERWAVLSTGVLSLLLTASVQLLALPVGIFMLRRGSLDPIYWPWVTELSTGINAVINPIIGPITQFLPQWALFVLGGGMVTFSFRLFDKALPEFRFKRAGLNRPSRLIYRPEVMFFMGLLITLLTLSVSVSIGILVPLSARGYVRRENIIPYVLGANISTMIDTLAAAAILGAPQGVTVVLTHMISAIIVSLPIVLLVYEPYTRLMSHALEWILKGQRNFAIFLAVFFLIPIALILS